MSEPRREYIAYLLRLWLVRREEGAAWRASLESARTGERLGFASVDQLFDFLRRRMAEDEMKEDGMAGRDKGRPPESGIQ
ncbi:MAG: hypothetical protein JXA09_15830 [Anaerolineae bacterium]|nr:hypothetical protein [Anaerolineae bacterium]